MSLLSYFVIFVFTAHSVYTLQCYMSTSDGTGTVTTIDSTNQTDLCNDITGCICGSFQAYCPNATFCTSDELKNNVTKWFYVLTDTATCSGENQTDGAWNITCCSTDLCNNQGINTDAITTTIIASKDAAITTTIASNDAAATTTIANNDAATTTTIANNDATTTTTIANNDATTTTTIAGNAAATTTTIASNAVTTTTTTVMSKTTTVSTTVSAANTTNGVTVVVKASSPMILPSFTILAALMVLCFAMKLA